MLGEEINKAVVLKAECLSSVILTNTGEGRFLLTRLPKEAQWSPIFSFVAGDWNRDGVTDVIASGNFYAVSPYEGRYDASYGNLLLGQAIVGTGRPSLAVMPMESSGLLLEGEVRDGKILRTARGELLLFSRTKGRLQAYRTR